MKIRKLKLKKSGCTQNTEYNNVYFSDFFNYKAPSKLST